MKKVLSIGIDTFTENYLSKYLQDSGYDVYGTSYPAKLTALIGNIEPKEFEITLRNMFEV